MGSLDRINNNYTNSYNNYSKSSKKSDGDVPAFLLDYDENGVFYEKSDDNKKDKNDKLNRKADESVSGEEKKNRKVNSQRNVKKDIYESSINSHGKDDSDYDNRKHADKLENKSDITKDDTDSFFNDILSIFSDAAKTFRNVIKKALAFLWYGNEDNSNSNEEKTTIKEEKGSKIELESDKQDNVSESEKNDTKSSEMFTEKTLRKYRAEREKKYNEELENAKRGIKGIPARNTTLLTTYDKFGRINKLKASESDIILRGDKSIKM